MAYWREVRNILAKAAREDGWAAGEPWGEFTGSRRTTLFGLTASRTAIAGFSRHSEHKVVLRS